MNANVHRPLKSLPIIPLVMIGAVLFECKNCFGQSEARVVSVEKHSSRSDADKNTIARGDYVKIEVENLSNLLRDSTAKTPTPLLYLDGLPLEGITPIIKPGDNSKTTLVFEVKKTPEATASWNVIYHFPRAFEKKVLFSVGYKGESRAAKNEDIETNFILIRKAQFVATIVSFSLLIIAVFVLAAKTEILRDQVKEPEDQPGEIEAKKKTASKEKPYSLSRTQLIYWSVIIVMAYVFIWIVTGELAALTGSTLALLGISIGTTAGAKLIDSSQGDRSRHQEKASENFLVDILSDDKGISVHRFQMVLWTVVLGIIFVRQVVLNLELPQLDDNLLALMGISNGAYVGLKIPENSKTPDSMSGSEPDSPAVG